jgi:hypothetical protein
LHARVIVVVPPKDTSCALCQIAIVLLSLIRFLRMGDVAETGSFMDFLKAIGNSIARSVHGEGFSDALIGKGSATTLRR